MIIREIPKSFEYVCDCCGEVHVQRDASGHYTQSTPPGWLFIKYWRAAAMESLEGIGDQHRSQEKLFCIDCRKKFDQFWIVEMNLADRKV